MSSTLRISRSILAVLVTIGIIFSGMPARIVNAAGEHMYLYAKLVQEESGTQTAVDGYYKDNPNELAEGYVLLGQVYSGYAQSDNVTVDLSTYDAVAVDSYVKYNGTIWDFMDRPNTAHGIMLLNSTLAFTDGTELTSDATIVYGQGVGFINQILEYSRDQNFDDHLTVIFKSGTHTISGPAGENGQQVWQKHVIVEGTLNIADCSKEPNVLSITDGGSLVVRNGGSIVGHGNAVLKICKGASVTGLTLKNSGNQEPPFEFDEDFTYDSDKGEWVIANQGSGPNTDYEGIEVRYPGDTITKVQYSIDNGAFADVPNDHIIPKESLTGLTSTIRFKIIPETGHEDDNFVFDYVDGPDYEHDEGWNRVTVDRDEGNDIVFTVNKTAITQDQFLVDIHVDGGPNNDFEGIDVRYDDNRITKVEYSIDNGAFADVPDNHIIPKSSLTGLSSTIRFKVTPKTGEENRNYVLEYIDNPDYSVQEKDWQWTRVARGEGTDIIFTVEKSKIASDKFVVSMFTDDSNPNNFTGIQVRFDDNRASKVQYAIDNGEFTDLPQNSNVIPKSAIENCTSIRFKAFPKEGEEDRNFVLEYIDNPDFNDEDHWVRTQINRDEGTDIIFTVPKSLIAHDQFVVDIITVDLPAQERFYVETHVNAGQGSANLGPDSAIIMHGSEGPGNNNYDISPDDWDRIYVDITPLNDGVVRYAVKSISVQGINTGYQITNNRFVLTLKPTAGTRIIINVEFFIPENIVLDDVAERGYAYTIQVQGKQYDEIVAEAQGYLATELWNYYFDQGRIYGGSYSNKAALNAALECTGHGEVNAEIVNGTASSQSWLVFKLTLGDSSIEFKVYVLREVGFLIKTPKANVPYEYDLYFAKYVSNGQGGGNDIVVAYDHDVGNPQIFGNGVDMEGVIISDSSDVFSGHVHQERTQLFDRDDPNYISVRLVIVSLPDSSQKSLVRIAGDQDCPGWQFDKLDIFTASSDRTNATNAYIYIGSPSIELSTVAIANNNTIADTIQAVEIDPASHIPSGLIRTSKNGDIVTVSFMDANNNLISNFDTIPLRLTIKDKNNQTSYKYITLHRVALRIDKYNNGDTVTLQGRYYYPTGHTAPGASDEVELYVTVTKNDGTKTSFLITDSDNGVKCSEEQTDNPYYSEYTLWDGSETDFGQIEKVEVIVISKTGNSNTHFGGIRVGFGNGVAWVKG